MDNAPVSRTAAIVVMLATACCGPKASPPADTANTAAKARAPERPQTKATAPPDTPAVDDKLAKAPPPPGVVLPEIGTVRGVEPGNTRTAYSWKATFDVDASAPKIAALVEAGDAADAGDAGALLYRAQVETTGADVTSYGAGAMYPIGDGSSVVMVLCSDQYHPDDPTGFSISVGPAGG